MRSVPLLRAGRSVALVVDGEDYLLDGIGLDGDLAGEDAFRACRGCVFRPSLVLSLRELVAAVRTDRIVDGDDRPALRAFLGRRLAACLWVARRQVAVRAGFADADGVEFLASRQTISSSTRRTARMPPRASAFLEEVVDELSRLGPLAAFLGRLGVRVAPARD